LVGGLAAAIGMALGFLWLRPSPYSAATLFGGGMVLAAILTHGTVRDVSPYYGLGGMAAGGAGGPLVGTWFLVRRFGAGTAAVWCGVWPTEFLASVPLDEAGERVAVVFGAGRDLFPPQSVYGFDVVDDYLAEGWRYWYALHNHTLQRTGDEIVLGVPAPSTSDISLAGDLAEDRGLQSVRVTNGFYTFIAETDELSRLRGR